MRVSLATPVKFIVNLERREESEPRQESRDLAKHVEEVPNEAEENGSDSAGLTRAIIREIKAQKLGVVTSEWFKRYSDIWPSEPFDRRGR